MGGQSMERSAEQCSSFLKRIRNCIIYCICACSVAYCSPPPPTTTSQNNIITNMVILNVQFCLLCWYIMVFQCWSYVFYLSAEADMKRELERKEQERKKSPKVEFIPGGVQPPIGASMPKIPGIMNMKQLHLMFWQIIITCPHKYLFDNIDVCYILSFSWCCDTSGTRRRCKKGD